MSPVLEAAVAESGNKVDLAKVDIDDLPDLALEYQVSKAWEGKKGGRAGERVDGSKTRMRKKVERRAREREWK